MQDNSANRVQGEYLVEMISPEVVTESLQEAFGDLGLVSVERLQMATPVYLITIRRDPGPQAMAQRADSAQAIVSIQPNYHYTASGQKAGTPRQ